MNAPIQCKRANDEIWGLVCGFSEPLRSNRPLLMLKAGIDDSNMNAPPVCVLGGWIGSAKDWAAFSDDWQEALGMRPRLNYFKLSEAQSFSGEFRGWSEQSRDERLRLLIKTIERYKFLGVTNAMPLDAYREVFSSIPDKGISNPYFLSFFGIVALLTSHFHAKGCSDKIDFIFDVQPGQVELVIASWEKFVEVATPELGAILGDYPIFRSDKTTLPLQAADMGVGWRRQLAEDHYHGRPGRTPPWGDVDLNVVGRYWTKEMMQELRDSLDLSVIPGSA